MGVISITACKDGSVKLQMDNGKYVRFTAEQVEALEQLYRDCPKPSTLRRQQLIEECPILSNIEPKHIKIWFQNRRCRDKQRKQSFSLRADNRKMSVMNRLLMTENDKLQKHVTLLVSGNRFIRKKNHSPTLAIIDNSCSLVVATGPSQFTTQPSEATEGLLSIAEETLTGFLSKATGSAIEWVQMPGMKPGPDSIEVIASSHDGSGIASRASGLVALEPTTVAEILRDRLSWFRDCRSVETLSVMSNGTGGIIEPLYMQLYAPTTLAPARDLWLLRYTSVLEDGSIVICERSLNNTQNGTPSMPHVQHFVRAEMFASGYLIRPCERGGSIVHIVNHMNLEPSSVPEVVRPLYESSTLLAQKTTMAALRHLRKISEELSQPSVLGWERRLAALRVLNERMSKGFNEAVNGFADEGWTMIESDGIDEVSVYVNSSPSELMSATFNYANSFSPVSNAVLCAKASVLLQNVSPARLLRFLRDHRSEWADTGIDAYSAAAIKASPCSIPVSRAENFVGQIILPLAHTAENEEFMEVIKLENMSHFRDSVIMPGDLFLLQLCSGMDENAVGTCAELVFTPIDASFTIDAPLVPSGFRITSVNSNVDSSTLEVGQSGNRVPAEYNTNSVLTIAFQFAFEMHLQENVAAMARQYVRSIISSVQRVASVLSPPHPGSHSGLLPPLGTPEGHALARLICQSYSFILGMELLKPVIEASESVLETLWHHSDAVMCCSLMPLPVFTFANQAGLEMLETNLVSLQDITLEAIFDANGRDPLFSELPQIMHQGFAFLPSGICMSSLGRPIVYESVVAWKLLDEEEDAHCICFMFVNWSFV